MVGMGVVVLGRWLWRYADHVVKLKVTVSLGAVFIIVILATSIGIGLYTALNFDAQTPTEFTPVIDRDADAAAPMNLGTPIPTPVPNTPPNRTDWDRYEPNLIANASLEQTVNNEDFVIARTAEGVNNTLGDGIYESTTWNFDFSQDPNFENFPSAPLAFARLELTLVPKNSLVALDIVRIEGLPDIMSPPQFQNLPVDTPTTVELELLDFYTSDEILEILSSENGQIPMFYADDSIVTSARLQLTSETQP
jgi:hypothetical protein